jgi:hypothetical protein
MELSKLKLTESQKACLIAISVREDGLHHTSTHEKAFNSLTLLKLIVHEHQFTEEQHRKHISAAWAEANVACIKQDFDKLRCAFSILESRNYSIRYVYRLTLLGQEWIEWWKAKQLGEPGK